MKHLFKKSEISKSSTGISNDSKLFSMKKLCFFLSMLLLTTFSSTVQLYGQEGPCVSAITSKDDGVCCCDGQILLNVINFTPPLRYRVYKDSNLMTDWVTITDPAILLENLCNGEYRIKIDDGTECPEYCPVFNINVSCLNVEIEDECNLQMHGCNGPWTVDGVASGGTQPYEYRWTSDEQGSTVLSTSSRINANEAGTYRLTVTDANGCSATDLVYLGPLKTEATEIIDADCDNLGEVNVEVKGGVFDCNICNLGPVIQMSMNKIDPLTGNQITWDGSEVEVTSDYYSNINGWNANWQPNTYLAAPSKRNFSIKNIPPGKYRIRFVDRLGCVDYLEFEIKEYIPTVDLVTLPIDCNTPSTGSVIASASGGEEAYTYKWLKDGVVMNGESGSSINNLSEGTYTVEVTDANGCTATKQIVLNPAISSTTVDLKEQVCFKDRWGDWKVTVGIKIPITAGTAPYTYVWSHSTINTNSSAINPGQTVTVTITDANGCTETFTIKAKRCDIHIDDDDVSKDVLTFPNPTTGVFTARITINGAPQETDINVVDISQNSYFSQNLGVLSVGQHDIPIDITSAPAGTYHLVINNGELSIAVVKN